MDASTTLSAQIFTRKCSAIAGFLFMILDASVLFGQEYRFIFRTPPTKIKWLYLFSRYYGIASQIAGIAFAVGPMSVAPVPSSTCRTWFYFQMGSFSVLLLSMEVILCLRVFAFYSRNWLVGSGLLLSITMELSAALTCAIHLIPSLEYDAACIILVTPKATLSLGGCMFITQCAIWLLTLFRYRKGRRSGWADVPVVSRVMRDGGLIFIGSTAMIVIVTPYSLRVRDLSHVISTLICSMFSIMTCRLILSMQNLRQTSSANSELEDSVLGLTSLESETSLDSVYDI